MNRNHGKNSNPGKNNGRSRRNSGSAGNSRAGPASPRNNKSPRVSLCNILDIAKPDGYEENAALIVESPGVRAIYLLYSSVARLMEQGYSVFYACFSKSPEMTEEEATSLGFDFEEKRKAGKLFYLDQYSKIFGVAPSAIAFSGVGMNGEEVNLKTVFGYLESVKGKKFVVADSVSSILDARKGADKDSIEFMEYCKRNRIGTLGILTDWNYPSQMVGRIMDRADCIVKVSFSGNLGTIKPFAILTKPYLGKLVPFRFSRTMHANPITPKILVAGPKSSGKTGVVYAASQKATSVKGTHVTIEMDQGQAVIDGCDYLLLSSQPNEFEHFVSVFGDDIAGAAITVNASALDTFAEVADLVRRANLHCVPCAVIANRIDSRLAPEEKVMELLGVRDKESFFKVASGPSSKEFGSEVRRALSWVAGKSYHCAELEAQRKKQKRGEK